MRLLRANRKVAVSHAMSSTSAAANGADRNDRICIVGAGPAGLSQARALLRAGLPFDVIERHGDVGGIWDLENRGTPMYESARFISSKTLSAFFDFPMPDDYPAYPDHTQFDKKSKYYDRRATEEKPYWFMVDVEFVRKFETPWSLDMLREIDDLADMALLRRGERLSVQEVTPAEWKKICKLAKVPSTV